MLKAKDYDKIGKVTWRAEVVLGNNAEPYVRTDFWAEYPTRSFGLARAQLERKLRQLERDDPPPTTEDGGEHYRRARLVRGRYKREEFSDDEFDLIVTGEWDHDEHDACVVEYSGFLRDDGTAVWDKHHDAPGTWDPPEVK